MTSSVIRKYALAALCGAAMFGVGQSAQAAVWNIFGGGAPASTATYGTLQDDNNVINNPSGAAAVYDNAPFGSTVVAGAQLQAFAASGYNITWTYLGSESGDVIQFIAPAVAGFPAAGFAETNANNQCSIASCGVNASGILGQTGTVNMGPLARFATVNAAAIQCDS